MKRDVRGTYSGMAHLGLAPGPPVARARPSCGPRVSLTELLFVLGIALSCRVAVFYNPSFLFAGRRKSVQVFMTCLHSSINDVHLRGTGFIKNV